MHLLPFLPFVPSLPFTPCSAPFAPCSLPSLPVCSLHSLFTPFTPLLLPSLPVCSLHSLFAPFTPCSLPLLPFPPLCSLNSLDLSLTLPHRWWGPFNLVYKYPYWLPLYQNVGTVVGTYKALWQLCEWRSGWHCTSRWWGHISTICDHRSISATVVGTLKTSIEMLSLPLLCVCSFLLPLLPVHSPSLLPSPLLL